MEMSIINQTSNPWILLKVLNDFFYLKCNRGGNGGLNTYSACSRVKNSSKMVESRRDEHSSFNYNSFGLLSELVRCFEFAG